MTNKAIKLIIIIVIICFSLIFSLPIVILSTTLAPYGKIFRSISFYYEPLNPSFMKELNINADLGNIDINYIAEPVGYCAKLDMNIEMIGSDLAGKSYIDYLDIIWENSSGIINFTLKLKENIDQAKILSLIKDIYIKITINANVICDISVILNIEGSVDVKVPWRISIGDILVNISKGEINYYFSNCIIAGEITGIIEDLGSIIIEMNDVEYINNSLWTLNANLGNVAIEINQHNTMGANVTGTIGTNIGNYRLAYLDNNVDVGAQFILFANQNDVPLHQKLTEIVGFDEPELDVVDGIDIYKLNSNDYPALNNYNLSFNLPYGNYDIDLQNN
jgi:hypothetical protein